jgi:hypothetical protein
MISAGKQDSRPKAPERNEPVDRSSKMDERPREIGGPRGPEPTRYGDWERAGRCIDF